MSACPHCGQELPRHLCDNPDTTPTRGCWAYYSDTEDVTVENRGLGFGKIYVFVREGRRKGELEAVLLWGPKGRVSEAGNLATSDDQRGRAVRALLETEAGRESLGFDPEEVSHG